MTHLTETELHDYIDQVLPSSAHDDVHAHIQVCAECAARASSLRALRAQAQALPASVEPPAELWAELRAVTIDQRNTRLRVLRELRTPLAAAALVLVGLVSMLTWYVARRTEPTHVVVREVPIASPTSLVALHQAETDQLMVTRTLLQVFEQRRAQMDPKVVAAVEQNLRLMDTAIAAAKQALASDPANQDVASILSTTYQSKVKMLRRAVRVSGDI